MNSCTVINTIFTKIGNSISKTYAKLHMDTFIYFLFKKTTYTMLKSCIFVTNNLVIWFIKSSPTLSKNNIENYCVSKKIQYQHMRNYYVLFTKSSQSTALSGWESNNTPSILQSRLIATVILQHYKAGLGSNSSLSSSSACSTCTWDSLIMHLN
jgi:hypothetical protein